MIAKWILPEVWWVLAGVNYVFAILGAYLGDNQLLFAGFITAICCIFSGYISKKERENVE